MVLSQYALQLKCYEQALLKSSVVNSTQLNGMYEDSSAQEAAARRGRDEKKALHFETPIFHLPRRSDAW
jgi:hypothetical protein